MKYANKLVSTFAAFSLLFMIACGGGDDSPTPNPGDDGDGGDGEVPGAAITGTWVQGTIDGPAADEFTDFSITINTTSTEGTLSYTTLNTNTLVFPASGNFTGIPADADFTSTVQVTNGDTPVDITLVNDDQLRMVFTIEADSGVPTDNSRTAEVAGEYTFLLDRDTQ